MSFFFVYGTPSCVEEGYSSAKQSSCTKVHGALHSVRQFAVLKQLLTLLSLLDFFFTLQKIHVF